MLPISATGAPISAACARIRERHASPLGHVVVDIVDRQLDVGICTAWLVPERRTARGQPHLAEMPIRLQWRGPSLLPRGLAAARQLIPIVRTEIDQVAGVVEHQLRADRAAGVRKRSADGSLLAALPDDSWIDE